MSIILTVPSHGNLQRLPDESIFNEACARLPHFVFISSNIHRNRCSPLLSLQKCRHHRALKHMLKKEPVVLHSRLFARIFSKLYFFSMPFYRHVAPALVSQSTFQVESDILFRDMPSLPHTVILCFTGRYKERYSCLDVKNLTVAFRVILFTMFFRARSVQSFEPSRQRRPNYEPMSLCPRRNTTRCTIKGESKGMKHETSGGQ